MVEHTALRQTPAGIPVLDCWLSHQSEQVEAGSKRQVQAHIKAVAVGAVADQLKHCELGKNIRFSGFLSSPIQRKGAVGAPRLVLHIQAFQLTSI